MNFDKINLEARQCVRVRSWTRSE